MTTVPILDEIKAIAESFSSVPPRQRTKVTGALAIEVIRRHLREAGIPVSARDVFVQGNPTEFDTLVVRASAGPVWGIVYEPRDVAAILEIKYSGVYSQDVPTALQRSFHRIKEKHPHIECVYLTVCENPPRPPSAFQPSRCTGGGTPSGPLIAPALLGALVTPFLIAWWAFVPFIALAWTFGQMSYRCQREAIRELALVNPTAYKFLLLDGIIVVGQTAQQERSSGLR